MKEHCLPTIESIENSDFLLAAHAKLKKMFTHFFAMRQAKFMTEHLEEINSAKDSNHYFFIKC